MLCSCFVRVREVDKVRAVGDDMLVALVLVVVALLFEHGDGLGSDSRVGPLAL